MTSLSAHISPDRNLMGELLARGEKIAPHTIKTESFVMVGEGGQVRVFEYAVFLLPAGDAALPRLEQRTEGDQYVITARMAVPKLLRYKLVGQEEREAST
jgi:hypothetical protein